jgi:hypothetical protein
LDTIGNIIPPQHTHTHKQTHMTRPKGKADTVADKKCLLFWSSKLKPKRYSDSEAPLVYIKIGNKSIKKISFFNININWYTIKKEQKDDKMNYQISNIGAPSFRILVNGDCCPHQQCWFNYLPFFVVYLTCAFWY